MPERRMRWALKVLRAAPSAILDFESFAGDLSFLSSGERCRLLVAGSEIFDNIVKHSSPIRGGRIAVGVRRSGGEPGTIVLAFRFRGTGFGAFAKRNAEAGACQPRFDPELRRWRGFGLSMCRNLSTRMLFESGALTDRIVVEFPSEG